MERNEKYVYSLETYGISSRSIADSIPSDLLSLPFHDSPDRSKPLFFLQDGTIPATAPLLLMLST